MSPETIAEVIWYKDSGWSDERIMEELTLNEDELDEAFSYYYKRKEQIEAIIDSWE